MENNGVYSNENGTATADNLATFPDNDDTQLQDISTLLDGAPVIQQPTPDKPASQIASAADFEKVTDKKPFSRRLGPKATTGAVISGLLMLPLSFIFLGGGSKKAETVAVIEETPEGNSYVSPEDYAAMQAELEQLRSQQAFTDQQVDSDAIDAAGRQQQENAQAEVATKSTDAAAKPTPAPTSRATTVSSRPAPAPRSAPTPSRVVAPSSRSAPVAASPQPTRVIQAPAREAEPVDPFERRAQLQALGTYGAPPPTTQAARTPSSRASNPFEMENPYIQAIAVELPQAQPAFSPAQTSPVERPLTEEELQYQQDANAVLAVEAPEVDPDLESTPPVASGNKAPRGDSAVLDPRRFKTSDGSQESVQPRSYSAPASPIAIMPGTSAQAELPFGFIWQEGTSLPEVLLMTTEDIMAGNQSVIAAGTQFLGQAQIDPGSGAVSIQVVGIFGETQSIQIPRTSVAVQAADGSVLMAKASGGASRSSSPNVGGFLMESFGNSLGNVLSNGDNVLMDVGGGLAETIIDAQVERSEAIAAARNSRTAAQPTVWTLEARPIQLTFNNYIPLNSASR
ncbi:hypothetical protein [cf. Phormidesmis sp. LEGE 11477]|uniref:hypothetical protein n=1 Tax=cf. Phormidesmis sp. LEGE 11477 TaxID=1828680 RepID=UPI00187FFF89|nr:hypothetical protein [cf. Phormidesmis sp. LEGE 11477]MBE9060324.1 hypothetical protein [cf. Phormidesmis sp. LEGE 11477]